MANPVILNYIKNHVDSKGVPTISNDKWNIFTTQHSQPDIKEALAEYITANNIPFPIKDITQQEFEDNFLKFCKTSMLGEYKDFDTVLEKYKYKYKYEDKPLGVIDKSHAYNKSSDYFQELNRMKCGSTLVDSPYNIWTTKHKLAKMNWHFWRKGALGTSDICAATFRSAFRLGTYTATQFKPSVAKALYEKHNAVKVLDTSCGWGDRLAGFYATPNTRLYVGCDPNPEVFQVYKQQCLEYERLLGGKPIIVESVNYFSCKGVKHVEIYNLPSEDVDWKKYENVFDFYFTSPPYFETEKYAETTSLVDNQSWKRYPKYDDWKNDFFFKVNRMVWDTLTSDAYMMINIVPPLRVRSKTNLCDEMVDDIKTYPNAHYLGKIGMRLQARPHVIGKTKNGIYIEPIYVFRKNNDNYPKSDDFHHLFSFKA
jgi:hypothetical protein